MDLAFLHRLYTRRGGVERNVVALTEGMAARGHRVTVFCSRADEEPPEGATLRRVPVAGPSALKNRTFDKRCTRALEEERFDIVQGFDLTTRQDVIRVGRGLVSVYREKLDATKPALDRLTKRMSVKQAVMKRLERRMFRPEGFRRIVAISRVVKEEIVEAYGIDDELIEVIYNGADPKTFTPEVEATHRAALREELDVGRDTPLVLYVGTGFHRKGVATLLEAFAEVRRALPEARLVVIGRDGRADRYRRLAAQLGVDAAVTWFRSRPDVERFYAAADVLALPTRYEPFGHSVLEALTCGLPVVVSAAAGSSEILEGSMDELILPEATDPKGLSERLLHALRDAAADRGLADVARSIGATYTMDRMLDEYEALYARLRA